MSIFTVDLFTVCWNFPLNCIHQCFAIARIVGWSAHRMEELINTDKIIRPAYKNVLEEQAYICFGKKDN